MGVRHVGGVGWMKAIGASLLLGILAPSFLLAQNAETVAPKDPYAAVSKEIAAHLQREIERMGIPSFSIAVVDDQEIVWAQAFGFADKAKTVPATPDTIYRVGSVSKLLSDVAVMNLIEQRGLDLDGDLRQIIPEFHPGNPFDQPITLRRLMNHQSGLVREPPSGNYFDASATTLRQTVMSLNQTTLVHPPGSKTKYSNAAVAVAGFTIEQVTGRPFAESMEESLLKPLGMSSSSYASNPAVESRLAYAQMWSYDGRRFDAPNIEMGCVPAGNLYSTVVDLAQFMKAIFGEGQLDGRQIISRELLDQMLQVSNADGSAANRTFGIGFAIGQLDGTATFEHSGAVYGFATDFCGLREKKLGVIAVASLDVANGFVSHIADDTLRAFLAVKEGREPPSFESTQPIDRQFARRVAGRYVDDRGQMRLIEAEGRLILRGEAIDHEIRRLGERLILDDVQAFGREVTIDNDQLRMGNRTLKRVDDPLPEAAPEKWTGLIGEYGWDHNTLFIYEDQGQLWALIEWVFRYPLTELDTDRFAFPDYGLYHDEQLHFTRDSRGMATQVIAAEVTFPRRNADLDNQKTYRITPQLSVERLREMALAAKPPESARETLPPDLVELVTLDPTIKLDIRYATENNFMGTVFYDEARAFMQRPAAEAVVRAHQSLKEKGYGLLIHDAYRPWYVTKMFWEATPIDQKRFVANPDLGSRHNRGCAVDLTLYDLKSGKAVPMVSGYDEFSERAYPNYAGGTSRQRWHRQLLRSAMEHEGFEVYEYEWWHFDYRLWESYPVLNLKFDAIPGK
jgi:CubicO group peptidase (beta-lactamase class C family)/D-alanyl-D-alanine dipeptidase